ncbi:MAG: hypothetical protein K2N63_17215 [Lachnospiraceae bacterium]|nr:hypothetical protein [Lachnospiraceae bacterium]
MERRAKQAVIGTLLVLVLILVLGGITLVKYLSPGKEVMSLADYYHVPAGEAMIILDDKIYEKNAIIAGGQLYVDFDTVVQRFNKRFYWDGVEQVLIYTTPTEVIKARPQENFIEINGGKEEYGRPAIMEKNGVLYLLLDFVAEYSDISYRAYPAEMEGTIQRVLITSVYGDYLYTNVVKETQLRTDADRKSPILKQMEKGEKLMLLDGGGSQKNGYMTVMTEDGVRGYILNKCVSEGYYERLVSDFEAPVYTSTADGEEVMLVWHVVTNSTANGNLTGLIANTRGVTTVSPTWFSIASNDGAISSLADSGYVDTAHGLGLKVWGLVDNFGENIDSYAILSSTTSRERLEKELVSVALSCGMDGINIDFESLPVEAGPHFIQFLRELSVSCRKYGLVLAVDNYVPAGYNRYYDFAEQGVIADYVIIMAYDEHYSGSAEAGSVSSISYVENAIRDTKEMVPAEKVIIALPFYTRLWKETDVDGVTVLRVERTPGMADAAAILKENNAVAEWDETTCQYYAEYDKDGAHYRIWLEDARSLSEKAKRVWEAKLAGIGAWRLGLETRDVWDIFAGEGE